MKKDFFELPKSKNAGIYMLYNATNHKVYIGETQNFHARATCHLQMLRSNTHSNKELQKDFNNNDVFIFTILEDMGETCHKDILLLKEKQYIFAFKDKYIKTYNQESIEQLKFGLFYDMVYPTINEIHADFHKKFGCNVCTLQRCKISTLKEKFEET